MNIDYDYVITKPDLNEDTLAHYGVKGMKWRKHKIKTKVASKGKYNYLDDLYKTDHPAMDLIGDFRSDLTNYMYNNSKGYRKFYDFMHTPITDIAKNTANTLAKYTNKKPSITGMQAYAKGESSGGHERSISTKERPVSRKKNTTSGSSSVKKKGSGKGTGKVGK